MDDDIKQYLDKYGDYVIILSDVRNALNEHTLLLKQINNQFSNGLTKKVEDIVCESQKNTEKNINILYYKFSGTVILVVSLVILIIEFIIKINK